jgi:[ribosomal protein S18]-alanine N-acetyltransferase
VTPPVPPRPARIGDLAALAALDGGVFGAEAYPPFFFRQALDVFGPLLLVAEAEGGGVAGYTLGAIAAGSAEGWVLSLAVAPAHRSRGLARALTEAVLARLEAAGAARVLLTVDPENRPAIALYERLGFAAVGGEDDYFGPGERRLVMARGGG